MFATRHRRRPTLRRRSGGRKRSGRLPPGNLVAASIAPSATIAAPDLHAAAEAIDVADQIVAHRHPFARREGRPRRRPGVRLRHRPRRGRRRDGQGPARLRRQGRPRGQDHLRLRRRHAPRPGVAHVRPRGDWGVDGDRWRPPARSFARYRDPEFLGALADQPGPRHLDGDMDMVADSFGSFARNVIAPHAEHVHRTNGDVPEEIVSGLAELGAFGLSVPAEYGGFSEGGAAEYMAMVVATEELSRASLGIGGSLITRPEILTRALVAGGTEEQKQHWLPKLAVAEVMPAVAVTEPDFGSDVAGIVVSATRRPAPTASRAG